MKPALAGFLGGVVGALAVGGALSAPDLLRGADPAATNIDPAALDERLRAVEAELPDVEDQLADAYAAARASGLWIDTCLRFEPARWKRGVLHEGRSGPTRGVVWVVRASRYCTRGFK